MSWVMDAAHVSSSMKKFIAQNVGSVRNSLKEMEFLKDLVADARVHLRVEVKSENGPVQMINYDIRNFKNTPNPTIARVAITHDRHKSNFRHPLTFEANGLIFDAATWNVLSYPPYALNPTFTRKSIIVNFPKYEIYRANDGTTVTLYHYDGQWRFASANGVDVGAYKWIGQLTYQDAFNDIAKLYPEFDFGKLNVSHTYSIGFRHSDFHKFVADSQSAWVIRVVDRATGIDVPLNTVSIGIPAQLPINRGEFTAKDSEGLYDELIVSCKSALTTYSAMFRGETAKTTGVTSYELAKKIAATPALHRKINYGYILRSPLAEGNFATNILLESELLKTIRQFMYNLPKQNTFECCGSIITIDNNNREKYCVLRNFLDRHNLPTFLDLFPQYSEKLVEFNARIENIIDKVIAGNKKESVALATPTRDDQIATSMLQFISTLGDVNISKGSRDIIRDFIIDPRNMRTFGLLLSA